MEILYSFPFLRLVIFARLTIQFVSVYIYESCSYFAENRVWSKRLDNELVLFVRSNTMPRVLVREEIGICIEALHIVNGERVKLKNLFSRETNTLRWTCKKFLNHVEYVLNDWLVVRVR